MNGKAAKRIRIAAHVLSHTQVQFRRAVKRLKRSYRAIPYHVRIVPKGREGARIDANGERRNPSHSDALRRHHGTSM